MPQREFQVGDRVKCIRTNEWGTEGDVGEVVEFSNRLYKVKWDAPLRLNLRGWGWWVETNTIELIVAPVTTFYTLVYKTRTGRRKQIMGYESEADFNSKKVAILAVGGTVYASKKIKLSNIGA